MEGLMIYFALSLLFIIVVVGAFGRRVWRALGFAGLFGAMKPSFSQQQSAPRQLQNLTQTYTGLIKRDFPEFDPGPFLTRAENTMVCILNSIEEGRITDGRFLSDNLRAKVNGLITDIQSKREKWHFDGIHVHKSCISGYRSLAGSKVISVQMALQYAHHISRDDKLVSGSHQINQYKYQIDAVYIQDVRRLGDASMKGHHCPSCGAPVTQTGTGKACIYCGTGLTEINVRIWTFDNYKRC